MPARIFGYNKQSVPSPTAGVSDTISPKDWQGVTFTRLSHTATFLPMMVIEP
jgi:hypothetical protein